MRELLWEPMSSVWSGLTRRDLPRSHNLSLTYYSTPTYSDRCRFVSPFFNSFLYSTLSSFRFFLLLDIPLFQIDF